MIFENKVLLSESLSFVSTLLSAILGMFRNALGMVKNTFFLCSKACIINIMFGSNNRCF